MTKIVPLDGYIVATAATELQSIETEMSEIRGLRFITIDTTAKRNDVHDNKTRVRLFNIESVSENASESVKRYVGRKMYCICLEKENANNIIVDKNTGNKLFIIPENDVLAELQEDN